MVLIKAGGYILDFRVFFDDQNVADFTGAQVLSSNPFQNQNWFQRPFNNLSPWSCRGRPRDFRWRPPAV